MVQWRAQINVKSKCTANFGLLQRKEISFKTPALSRRKHCVAQIT
jgi:hypothetical protein